MAALTRSHLGRIVLGSKVGLLAAVILLLVVSGLAVRGLVEAAQPALSPFDEAGEARNVALDRTEPMDRPDAAKGVKLGKPDSSPAETRRALPPLKAKERCADATAAHGLLGVKKDTKICALGETRQSPDLLKAPPLRMAKGFKPAPMPEPEVEPTDEPSADPSASPSAGAFDDSDSDEDENADSPDISPSSEPSPGETPDASGSEGSAPRSPTDADAAVKPAAFRPGSLQIQRAAQVPMLTENPPGEYLSPNWTQLQSAASPGFMVDGSLVYDDERNQFVYFGGRSSTSNASDETWVWSGTTWTKLSPAAKPPARYGAGMTWDPVQKKIILFGGSTAAGTMLNDVWAWNGTTWAQQTPTGTAPLARVEVRMAYDPVRAGIVIFGGHTTTANRNDTWQLKNNAWTQIQAQGAAGAPSARNNVSMAYSVSTSQLVMFGGGTGGCPTCTMNNETWILGPTATTWTKQTTTPARTPAARGTAAITYDPGMGAVIMFGGISGDGTTNTLYNDTWAWTGTEWSKAVGIASPSARAGGTMAASESGQVLYFGGLSETELLPETWTYDSSLPVIDIEVQDAHEDPQDFYWAGEQIRIVIKAANAGVNAILASSGTTITSALTESVLAAGSEITWDNLLINPCEATGDLCGGVSGLTTTITNLSIPVGQTQVGDFVATLAGTQRGCELIDIPALVASVTGGTSETFQQITVCGGGLGLENWWTYDTTDLGNGGTASVNAANGNLVVKQYDTAPVQTPGRLQLGLGRAYNSQDRTSLPALAPGLVQTDNRPLGAGWQFDIGDTGEFSGGLGIAGLKLPNLQNLTQPLSMPYVDRDGTRHVFKLRSVGVAAGDMSLPIDLSNGVGGVLGSLLGGLNNLSFNDLLADGGLTNLCIDQAYTGPKGSNMFLFRYVGVGGGNGCANPADAGGSFLELGWSLVRPDRVRYDFNILGDLISVTDPTGQQIRYDYNSTLGGNYGPTKIYTKSCGKSGAACPTITIDYDFSDPDEPATVGNPHRLVRVIDSAKRKTTYVVTTGTLPQLKEVWLPGNNYSDAPGAKPSISYAYTVSSTQTTGKLACDGTDVASKTVGQLCRVTDAQGGKTTVSYTDAAPNPLTGLPMGPDRVLQITDRRGNAGVGGAPGSDGPTKGLATRYTWTDKPDGAPDIVTADMAAPNAVTTCGATCQRVRYSRIDAHGRVGQIDEGSSVAGDSKAITALRQAGYFWDGGTEPAGIASCSSPAGQVNHNLCQTIRRAVPSADPLTPATTKTSVLNGVTVHDEAIDYTYGSLGQVARKKVLLDAAGDWAIKDNFAITTYGSNEQYFDPVGGQRAFNTHVIGNGDVASTGAGSNYATTIKKDSPIAYWRLGEGAGASQMKSATGANHGNYAAGATLDTPGAVPGDTALAETPANFSANISSLANFAHGTTPADSDLTIEMWQKATDTNQDFAVNWGASGASGLAGRTFGGRPMLSLRSDVPNNKGITIYTNAAITDGAWHHVVYTYDGSGHASGAAIWIDGVKQPTTTFIDNLDGAFAQPGAYAQFFLGATTSAVDEVALFNKVLTPARIQAHRDAAFGGDRVEPDTLYAVVDQTQELSPRGNKAANWGEHLTSIRRDIPADGTSASTFGTADADGICGPHDRGNTGLVCEVDTPASGGVNKGACATTPVQNLPYSSPAAPTGAGYASTCTTYTYNTVGQRTTMRTPKSNATNGGSFEYKYYDTVETCGSGDRNNCDLSATVTAGGWLKAVVDPAGEKTVFAYDAAGNIARTWERNATHASALTEPWSNPSTSTTPSEAYTDQVNATPVTSEALSVSNTALITVAPDGTTSGAGSNSLGELGDTTTTARSHGVPAAGLSNVVAVSQTATGAFSGCAYVLYLTGGGEVWFTGAGFHTPIKIGGLKDVIAIQAAGCHLLALEADGELFAWGNNGNGQVGNGTTSYVGSPVKVLDNVATMGGGYLHSLAVKTDGTVWTWGANADGQLGLGDNTDRNVPTKVNGLNDPRSVIGGVNASYAIGRDGKVWAWGTGANGALGLGDTTSRNTPARITTLGPGSAAGQVLQIAPAAYGAAALMANGKVRAWGLNNVGQLGSGTTNSTTPVEVPGVSKQVAIAGGWATYAAADASGKVTVWGGTGNNQRADGTSPTTSAPVEAGINISPYRLPGWELRGQRDATGNLITQTVDKLGNIRRVRSGRGNEVLTSSFDRAIGYDAAARPIWTSGAQHRATDTVTSVTYDPYGNPTKTIDARGFATRATFDTVNRQLTAQATRGDATEAADATACTGTATAADWTTAQDGMKVCTTSTTYDGVDRAITATDANSQVTRYFADAGSRQTRVDVPRNANGYTWVTTRTNYDADGNVTDVCLPRQFDAANEANTTMGCTSDGKHSTHYTINRAGLTTSETRYRSTTALSTDYTYDADGNTTSVTDPNGHTTTQSFDLNGRLKSRGVPRNATKINTTTWDYDYSGNVTSITSPGSLATGAGIDGNLVVDGSTAASSTDGQAHGAANPFKVPDGAQYTNVTLQNGAHVTATAANGLMFQATGTVTVCATCVITMDGKGYAGGAKAADAPNPNPGPGGLKGAGANGGGGGGHKTDGDNGAGTNPGLGGKKTGDPSFSDVGTNYLTGSGGGGGGGGTGLLGSGGAGGAGGGYIRITAGTIIVNGSITAKGANGLAGTSNSGGGGGGAGGGIWLAAGDIQLANPSTISAAGGTGGTAPNDKVGGTGAAGLIRLDGDTVTNPPAGVDVTNAAMVTAISYDAANRPLDTVEGARTFQADPTKDNTAAAVPDSAGLANTRTRAFYNADGVVAALLPPTAFSDAASLTAPNLDVARRVDYDLDGQTSRVYSPRYSDTVTSIGGGNDGSAGLNQQTSQCTTGRVLDYVPDAGTYGSSVGVCATKSNYDAAGNLARQWFPSSDGSDNRYLEYTYTPDGLTKNVTGPDPNASSGRVTVNAGRYDGVGNPTRMTDALGHITQTAYTADGLVKQTTGQSYTVDSVTVTETTTFGYDANGNSKSVDGPIAGTNDVTAQTWTTDNLVASISAPGPDPAAPATKSITRYTYDKVGNPIEVLTPVEEAKGATGQPVVNEFTHDNLIKTAHTPITADSYRSVQFTYSPAGRKTATETARCVNTSKAAVATDCAPGSGKWNSAGVMRLGYGSNGRVSDEFGRDKSSISTVYTQDGQPRRITDPTSSVTITAGYYLDGRLRTVDDGSNANTYAYDAAGQPTVRTDQTPGTSSPTAGAKVTTSYSYNTAGLPAAMTSEVLDATTNYSYDDAGRLTQSVTGSHVNDWSWHPNNALAGVRNAHGATTVSEYVYRYDNSRSIKSQTVTGAGASYTNTYGYAPGRQVTSWTRTGADAKTVTYGYDRNSNRTTATDSTVTGTDTWAYNADNSIKSFDPASATVAAKTYTYNNAGHLTGDGCATTTYDDFDRVKTVENTTTTAASGCNTDPRKTTYSYDGLDRQRTLAVTGSNDVNGANDTTKSVYDGLTSTVVGQTDAVAGNNATPEILYQLDAAGDAVAYDQTSNTVMKAHLDTDGHGNVTNLTNTAGTIGCTVAYDPYGGPVGAATGATSNGMCRANTSFATTTGNSSWYRGTTRDGSTGSYQYGTRTYNPTNGAFATPDTYRVATPSTDLSVGVDPLTANTYAYVNGNPLNMWDPTGHRPDCVDEGTCSYGMRDGHMVVTPKTPASKSSKGTMTAAEIEAYGKAEAAQAKYDELSSAANAEFDWKGMAYEIVGEVSGLNDIMDCAEGDGWACAAAVGGFMPWGKGAKMAKSVWKLIDKYRDFKKARSAAQSALGSADEALEAALAHADEVTKAADARRAAKAKEAAAAKRADESPGETCFRSFSADTPVLMGDGTRKPISEIKVGDRVLATDPVTGAKAAKKVTALWIHLDDLTDLVLADGSRVTTTDDHPFWNATDQVWEDISEFDAGDDVITDQWRRIDVVGLDPGSTHRGWAYNLTVDGLHTYHVSDRDILVHNCNSTVPGPNNALRDTKSGQFAKNPDSARSAASQAPSSTHGNSRFSDRETHLYQLTDAFGNHLKWGITSNWNTRYSASFLSDKVMVPISRGTRSDMLDLERWLVERMPGPMNLERWAGLRQ